MNIIPHFLLAAIEEYDRAVASVGGCSDGGCVIKRPKGMHTNGGCRCYHDKIKAQRMMRAGQLLRAALEPTENKEPMPYG
jgi:hypothetical protein